MESLVVNWMSNGCVEISDGLAISQAHGTIELDLIHSKQNAVRVHSKIFNSVISRTIGGRAFQELEQDFGI